MSQAQIKEASAEIQQSSNMESMRKHDEKIESCKSLEHLARSGHMVISGKNGQDMLNYYNNALE